MSDMVQSYLSRLQSGYFTREIAVPCAGQPSMVTFASYNPYRVALYVSFPFANSNYLHFRLPSGIWCQWDQGVNQLLRLNWINDQHLVYQEWGLTNPGDYTIRGIEVLKV